MAVAGRGLPIDGLAFDDRVVVSLLTGEPEYLEPLGDDAPEGWIVTGYPSVDIPTPAHRAFAKAYIERWAENPKTGSIVGYNSILSIAAAMEKAGSTETEAMLAAMVKAFSKERVQQALKAVPDA